MKQKIKITGVNVHDLLYESFLMRMAFDATVMKFLVIKETVDGKEVFDSKTVDVDNQQVLILLLEDRERQIEYFKRLLESRDYNTDEEQLKYCGGLMERTGSKVQITQIEYEPYDEEVPELSLTMTVHNCKMMDAFCEKDRKR